MATILFSGAAPGAAIHILGHRDPGATVALCGTVFTARPVFRGRGQVTCKRCIAKAAKAAKVAR